MLGAPVTPEDGDCGPAEALSLGFEREKPNQDDREGVDLTARMVSCGSTEGNGIVVSVWETVEEPLVGSHGSAAGSSWTSIGFGDSVRSTGFVKEPDNQSAILVQCYDDNRKQIKSCKVIGSKQVVSIVIAALLLIRGKLRSSSAHSQPRNAVSRIDTKVRL